MLNIDRKALMRIYMNLIDFLRRSFLRELNIVLLHYCLREHYLAIEMMKKNVHNLKLMRGLIYYIIITYISYIQKVK